MNLIRQIKAISLLFFNCIKKKTNPIIFLLQIGHYKIFKTMLFKKIKINKLNFNFTNSDDLYHIKEYINNYYNIDNIKNLNICIDVGANSGDFSLMLSKNCKQIYAIEPIDFVYQKMLENINDNGLKNIKAYNFGLSYYCGKTNISIPENHTGGSKIDENGDYEIKIISWSKFYEIIGRPKTIDLLKIDCEGCEYSLLKDSNILNYVKEIRMEIHIFDNNSIKQAKKLICLLYKQGFKYTNMNLKEAKIYINQKITTEHFFIRKY